jgi:hypothetical protein
MNKILIVFIVIFTSCFISTISAETKDLFENWKSKFGINIKTMELTYRKSIFEKNLEKV